MASHFDLASLNWTADYPDSGEMLSGMLDNPESYPTFNSPYYHRRVAAAGQLSGPERYLDYYGKLAVDLARAGAPPIAYGNLTIHEFFSERIGCKTPASIREPTSTALCIKRVAAEGRSEVRPPASRPRSRRGEPARRCSRQSERPTPPRRTSPLAHKTSRQWRVRSYIEAVAGSPLLLQASAAATAGRLRGSVRRAAVGLDGRSLRPR